MSPRLSRRSFVGLGAISAASLATGLTMFRSGSAAGCSIDPSFLAALATPAAQSPELLLRVESVGGFVPPQISVTELPWFSLYEDGTVITTGPMIEIYPQPVLPNLREMVISPEGIERVLAEASAAGLDDGPATYTNDIIAAAPTTNFILRENGEETVVSAYALGINEEMLPAEPERDARAKLLDLSDFLLSLAGNLDPAQIVTPDQAYDWERITIYATPIDPANPPGADSGLEQTPVEWPLGTPLADFQSPDQAIFGDGSVCGTAEGEDAQTLKPALEAANQITPWISGDAQYQIWVRPLLPDQPSGC